MIGQMKTFYWQKIPESSCAQISNFLEVSFNNGDKCKNLNPILRRREIAASKWVFFFKNKTINFTSIAPGRGGEVNLGGVGGVGGVPPVYFLQLPVFLQSYWRITNSVIWGWTDHYNARLTYLYANTTETYLTPNHLLWGRQLSYSSKKTSIDRINRVSNNFWDRWKHE